MSPDRTRWLLLAAAAIVLVVHSLAYDFVTDDAYISFVYARNLAEHGELAFNLGSPVEGYTNFLWTVVLGVLMLFGAPPEPASRVLGTICSLVTLYLVMRIMDRAFAASRGPRGAPTLGGDRRDTAHTVWAAVPSLVLACSSGFACWTSGGLETALFTMLVTGALEGVVAAVMQPRALRRVGVLAALAAMTRPEGLLVAACLAFVHLGHRVVAFVAFRRTPFTERTGLRNELVAAGMFLALWLPWFGWRWWYYGWPFPNTYYVKAAGPWIDAASPKPQLAHQMVDNGLYYIWVWLQQTKLLYILPLAAVGLVVGRARSPRFVLAASCTVIAALYLSYTASVGGDFMGLHRFIMPVFVIAAIAVVLGFEAVLGFVPTPRRSWAIVAGVALVVGFGCSQYLLTRRSLRVGNFASDRGIDTPAFLIVYTEDRANIGRAMAPCVRPEDFSILGGAGALPYHARLRGIDVFGLVSSRIAHEEPRIRARAGHTKWGSDRLLAEYDPTFVLSCYRLHRTAAQPQLPCAPFWHARGFEHVTLRIPGLREQGEYYTFLAKKTRDFQCPSRVH